MKKIIIATDKAPQAIGPYSQAIEANGFLFISGQIPLIPETGEMVSGEIEAQTERVLQNLGAILNQADLTFDDVLKTTVYLSDINHFARMNAVYAKFFKKDCPARVCVAVKDLPKQALVEIDVIACHQDQKGE